MVLGAGAFAFLADYALIMPGKKLSRRMILAEAALAKPSLPIPIPAATSAPASSSFAGAVPDQTTAAPNLQRWFLGRT